MLVEPAPAKVNLFLRVVGRRPDGYHLLDSLAVFAGVHDNVRVSRADDLSLDIDGPFGAGLAAERDNLVLRAARSLAAEAGIRPDARILLEKNLPIASGIGGGSADAAATLRGLIRLWGIAGIPDALPLALGADVPVCVGALPAVMGGVGEILSAAPHLPPYGMVLVNPGLAVATPAVFGARRAGFSAAATLPAVWPDAAAMAADCAALGNDLQDAAIGLCPVIGDVLAAIRALPGCLLAQMSGSGATCFGLFATPEEAAAGAKAGAAALLVQGWWWWGGGPHAGWGLPEGARQA